jgi:hypothetical protein
VPNWTPSEDHIRRVIDAVTHLTNRRATMMEAGYPLDFEQVQAIVTPPRLMEFVKLGYDSLQKTHHICYEMGPAQELARRSITHVSLPQPIQYAFDRQLNNNFIDSKPIYFNSHALDAETTAKLVAWTNEAVYERRLAKLVNATVVSFFTHTPKLTMYHIMARWPGLKVVFPRTTGAWRGGDMWERHSNETPRNLQRWGWPAYGPEADWRAKYQRRLELTEETLLSCVSLKLKEDTERVASTWRTPRKLIARVTDWQVLGEQPF